MALRGVRTGAQVGLNAAKGLIGAQRLAQIGAKSAQVLERVKFAAGGIVRVGRRAEDVADNAPPPRHLPAGATNAQKGVFGEAMFDDWMANQGYQKLNGNLL